MTPCKRGCCWTPYGHSTVRDAEILDSRRCHCHTGKSAQLEALLRSVR